MILSRKILVTVGIILNASWVLAQSDFVVNPDQVNPSYLVRSIRHAYDSLRKTEGNAPLNTHAQLQSLAEESATSYLSSKKITGSSVEFKLVKKLEGLPFDSETIGSLGTVTEIEEPIHYFTPIVNYTYRNQTYRQTVLNLVQNMSASKDYKRLIADPRISQIGVGIAYETSSHLLAVVCYFASGPSDKSSQSEDLPLDAQLIQLNNQSPEVWFKRSKRQNRNLLLAQQWSRDPNSYTGWVTTSLKDIRRAFRWYHLRSGLVSETISAEQFASDPTYLREPSRTHQRAITNGTIGSLLKRKDIINSWKEQTRPKPLKLFGIKTFIKKWPRFSSFKIPTAQLPHSTSHLLVVRKAKLCDIISINPTVAKELNPAFPQLPFLLPKGASSNKQIHTSQQDSSEYQVYYPRGVTQLNDDDKVGLLKMIEEGTQVSKIMIRAFASIEGNLAANEKLFKERAAIIQSFLEMEGMTSGNAEVILNTDENWNDMRKQLQAHSTLSYLADRSESEIRSYINGHLSEIQISEWLNAQRFAWVHFELIRPIERAETPHDVILQFDALLAQSKPNVQTIQKLAALQKRYYSLLVARNESPFDSLRFPTENQFALLRYQRAVFRYQHRSDSEETFHDEIMELLKTPGISTSLRQTCLEHHHTFLANQLFFSHSLSPTREEWSCPREKTKTMYLIEPKAHKHVYSNFSVWLDALDLVKKVSQTYLLHKEHQLIARQLDLYYLVSRSQQLLRENKFNYIPEAQKLAKDVWQRHVAAAKLTEPEIIEYVLYFNLTHNSPYATRLLKPLVERAHPNPGALMIWISMHAFQWGELKTEQEVLRAQEFLSKEAWCELVDSGTYLPLTFLERYKIRHAWYANRQQ